MTLPNEQVARFKPGDNIPCVASPDAVEAGRFVKITGKHAKSGAYVARHCTAGERCSGVSERKVPAVAADVRPDNRHGFNINRIGAIAWVETGAAVAVDDLIVSDGTGRAVPAGAGGAASLDTGTVGANNAITWTAREPGTGGNSLSVTLVDPPGNNVALSVDVDGDDIVVTLATDGASAVTSTATAVQAAVLEHDTASQLVTTANKGASSGAGVVAAVAKTNLAGGSDAASEGAILGTALTAADAAGKYIELDRG